MGNLAILPIEQNVYCDNLVPLFCNFDSAHTWNIVSGTGAVENNDFTVFSGNSSLKITKSVFNTANTLVFNSGGTEMNTEAPETGLYQFSFYVFVPESYVATSIPFMVRLFTNAVESHELDVNFSAENGLQFGKWQRVVQQITLNRGDILSFEFEAGFNTSSSFSTVEYYIDGFSLILNNKGLVYPPLYFPAI